jgi:hypothetical protein
MHRPELLRKRLVGEKGGLKAISCIPVEGEPDYFSVEEAEHDGSPHRRHASATPGRPRDPPERHGAQTFTPGTHLPLEEAGRRSGLNPNRQRYYDAIAELEYEGAIEWDESARYARGDKHYLITRRGLKMLREPG